MARRKRKPTEQICTAGSFRNLLNFALWSFILSFQLGIQILQYQIIKGSSACSLLILPIELNFQIVACANESQSFQLSFVQAQALLSLLILPGLSRCVPPLIMRCRVSWSVSYRVGFHQEMPALLPLTSPRVTQKGTK